MFQRDNYLKKIIQFKDTEFVKIITGVRRSGKSFLLKLYDEHLKSEQILPEQIIYLNFEDYEKMPFYSTVQVVMILEGKNISNNKGNTILLTVA